MLILIILTGCGSLPREGVSGPEGQGTAGGAERGGERASPEAERPPRRDRASALAALQSGLPPGLVPVRFDGDVVADWFAAMPAAGTPGEPGNRPERAMGLFSGGDQLFVLVEGGQPLAVAEGVSLRRARSRSLETASPAATPVRAQLLELALADGAREELLLVVPRLPSPYTLRIPISAASRAQLRDLDGDGLSELLTTSVVFDASGRRELVVDALGWDGRRFTHRDSVSLLRELNTVLRQLQRRLERSGDPAWTSGVNRALQPIEGAPAAGGLLPATVARVPEVVELSLDLDQAAWDVAYELALDGNIYRIQLRIEANPLMEQPVSVTGLEDL